MQSTIDGAIHTAALRLPYCSALPSWQCGPLPATGPRSLRPPTMQAPEAALTPCYNPAEVLSRTRVEPQHNRKAELRTCIKCRQAAASKCWRTNAFGKLGACRPGGALKGMWRTSGLGVGAHA